MSEVFTDGALWQQVLVSLGAIDLSGIAGLYHHQSVYYQN